MFEALCKNVKASYDCWLDKMHNLQSLETLFVAYLQRL